MSDKFLSKSELLGIAGLSPVTQWREEKAGRFPKRRQISPNRVAWLESEILDWMSTRPVSHLPSPKKGETIFVNDRPVGKLLKDIHAGHVTFQPTEYNKRLAARVWRTVNKAKREIQNHYQFPSIIPWR